MFKSFFPNPRIFLLTAAFWGLTTVLAWFGYFESIPAHFGSLTQLMTAPLPVSAYRFIHPAFIWFYLYYWICIAIFALLWQIFSPHPWQRWSIWGTALMIFTTWFSVEISVGINAWYGPFGDMIQQALVKHGSTSLAAFYQQIIQFSSIAAVAIVMGVVNQFYVSHWIFRWRSAMNEHYTQHWQQLRHIEGAAQRVQEDTMSFASTLENWGIDFIKAIMTVIAFLPVLINLSTHIKTVPLLGTLPYGLVILAILWSLFGTALMATVGIKLPGLSFNNQKTEAAYRKELVYGEDDQERAQPLTLVQLFKQVRSNYFRIYFHYMYFNFSRLIYLQADNIFGLVILLPSIVAGTLTLGLMNQISNVLEQVRAAFQYLIKTWSILVDLLSIYKRLRTFERAIVED